MLKQKFPVPVAEGNFELPVQGATGYTTVSLPLWSEVPADVSKLEDSLAILTPGTAFTVLAEEGNWWRVHVNGQAGWLEHQYCMINLPDVVPSIIYNATNSYSSLFISSGKAIPGITGEAFYIGAVYNPRLDREEFLMPVLYTMAKQVCRAQQLALREGNSLILYEGYRPYKTQQAVCQALEALAQKDPEVKAGISSEPWSINWFISTSRSNHQFGYAIDVGLAKICASEEISIGEYTFLHITDHTLYEMPTKIHELSQAAATFAAPVSSSNSPTEWKSAQLSKGMNEAGLALQRYCTGAGLTPLSSEWWHFNDLTARAQVLDNLGAGDFEITQCLSTAP